MKITVSASTLFLLLTVGSTTAQGLFQQQEPASFAADSEAGRKLLDRARKVNDVYNYFAANDYNYNANSANAEEEGEQNNQNEEQDNAWAYYDANAEVNYDQQQAQEQQQYYYEQQQQQQQQEYQQQEYQQQEYQQQQDQDGYYEVVDEDTYLNNLEEMSIQYKGCSSFMETESFHEQLYSQNEEEEEEDGQDQDEQQDYQQQQEYEQEYEQEQEYEAQNDKYVTYQKKARYDGLQPTNLVRFALCPSSNSCEKCSGEYVVEMEYFLEAYMDYKMTRDNYWCERVRQGCVCQRGESWKECYGSCFEQMGLNYDDCLAIFNSEAEAGDDGYSNSYNYHYMYKQQEQEEESDAFQVQQYLQCSGVEFYNPKYMYNVRTSNSNYQEMAKQQYYLGLTCDNNHQDVMLTGFYDEQCSYRLKKKDLKLMQAALSSRDQHVPYVSDGRPILKGGMCLSCKAEEDDDSSSNSDNDDGEEEQQPDATDLCEMATTSPQDGGVALICDSFHQDACQYIQKYLPRMDGRSVWTKLERASLLNKVLIGIIGLLFIAGLVQFGALLVGQFQQHGYAGMGGSSRSVQHREALLKRRDLDGSDDETGAVLVSKPFASVKPPVMPRSARGDNLTEDEVFADEGEVSAHEPMPTTNSDSDDDAVVITSPSKEGEMA